MADHLSVKSERPKVHYYKSTLDSHKKIKFNQINQGSRADTSRVKSRGGYVSDHNSNSEIENDIPQMSKLFDSNSKIMTNSVARSQIELHERCDLKTVRTNITKSIRGFAEKHTKAVSIVIDKYDNGKSGDIRDLKTYKGSYSRRET